MVKRQKSDLTGGLEPLPVKREKKTRPAGWKRNRFAAGINRLTGAFFGTSDNPKKPLVPFLQQKTTSQGRTEIMLGSRKFVTGTLPGTDGRPQKIVCEHADGLDRGAAGKQQECYYPVGRDMMADSGVELLKGEAGGWIVKGGAKVDPASYLPADSLAGLHRLPNGDDASEIFRLGDREYCMGKVVHGGSAARTVAAVVERVTQPGGAGFQVVNGDLTGGASLELMTGDPMDPFQLDCFKRVTAQGGSAGMMAVAMGGLAAGLTTREAPLLAQRLLAAPGGSPAPDETDAGLSPDTLRTVYAKAGAAVGAARRDGLGEADAIVVGVSVMQMALRSAAPADSETPPDPSTATAASRATRTSRPPSVASGNAPQVLAPGESAATVASPDSKDSLQVDPETADTIEPVLGESATGPDLPVQVDTKAADVLTDIIEVLPAETGEEISQTGQENSAVPPGLSPEALQAINRAAALAGDNVNALLRKMATRDRSRDGLSLTAIHSADRALYVDGSAHDAETALVEAKQAAAAKLDAVSQRLEDLRADERDLAKRLAERDASWAAAGKRLSERREEIVGAASADAPGDVAEDASRRAAMERSKEELRWNESETHRLQNELNKIREKAAELHDFIREMEKNRDSGTAQDEYRAAVTAMMRARAAAPEDSQAALASAKAAAHLVSTQTQASATAAGYVSAAAFLAYRSGGEGQGAELAGLLMAEYLGNGPDEISETAARAAQAAIGQLAAEVTTRGSQAPGPSGLMPAAAGAAVSLLDIQGPANLRTISAVMVATASASAPALPPASGTVEPRFNVLSGAGAAQPHPARRALQPNKTKAPLQVPDHYELLATANTPNTAEPILSLESVPLRSQRVSSTKKTEISEEKVQNILYMIEVEDQNGRKVWCDYAPGAHLRDTCGEIPIRPQGQTAEYSVASMTVAYNGITGKWGSYEDREVRLQGAKATALQALRDMVRASDNERSLGRQPFHGEDSAYINNILAMQTEKLMKEITGYMKGTISPGTFTVALSTIFVDMAKVVNNERIRKKVDGRQQARDVLLILIGPTTMALTAARVGLI